MSADGRAHAYGWVNLFMLFVLTAVTLMCVATFPPLAPLIMKDLRIGWPELGSFMEAYLIMMIIASPIAGRIADRIGSKVCILIGIFLLSMGEIGFAYAPDYVFAYAFRLLLGIGAALSWNPSPKILGTWIPPKQLGFGIGIWTGGIFVGSSIIFCAAPVLATVMGWRASVVAFGVCGLLCIIPAASSLRERVPTGTDRGTPTLEKAVSAPIYRSIYTNPWIWNLGLLQAGQIGVNYVLTTFGAAYSTTILPIVEAGLLSTFLTILGLPLVLVGG
jgi:AAHS family 4-hydroxybenzoate transporter-like MFS transporter